MKLAIESTGTVVTLDGIPARMWTGRTDAGTPVCCYITRISPQTHDAEALAAFDAELRPVRAPRPEAIPLRLVL